MFDCILVNLGGFTIVLQPKLAGHLMFLLVTSVAKIFVTVSHFRFIEEFGTFEGEINVKITHQHFFKGKQLYFVLTRLD